MRQPMHSARDETDREAEEFGDGKVRDRHLRRGGGVCEFPRGKICTHYR
jgi:hypothetical protein